MKEIADIHCHLLPYVDDGAMDLEEAMELLREEHRQGVYTVCLTPHLRTKMFETPDEKIQQQFERLNEMQRREGLNLRMHLSREYFCDKMLFKRIRNGKILPLGNNHILLEFSTVLPFSEMKKRVEECISLGYHPLIAHIERCYAVREDKQRAEQLIQLGAKLQVNAGSILGKEGLRKKWLTHWLLKQGLVYAVASDAHDMEYRVPLLEQCHAYLTKKYNSEFADTVLRKNPLDLLEY